ncbi:MAG: alpha/beta fold hydrolase, partial [Spirochaetota bacterium]
LELRGHGLSGGRRSHIRDFALYATDLRRFLYGNLQNRPVYLVACGAGALPVIRLAADPRFSVKGVVFVSPYIFPRMERGRRFMIRLLSRVLPQLHVPNPAQGDFLRCMECAEPVSDAAVTAQGFTAGFFGALCDEIKRAQRDIPILKNFPAMLLLGENDPVIDASRTEQLFKNAWQGTQNLTIASCKRCGHHLLLEKDRIDFVERITKWIHKLETGL